MRLIVLVLVIWALVACKLAEPATWHGVPPDAPRACTWPEQRGTPGTCIIEGAAYACVHDSRANRVDCARTSPLWTPESGK